MLRYQENQEDPEHVKKWQSQRNHESYECWRHFVSVWKNLISLHLAHQKGLEGIYYKWAKYSEYLIFGIISEAHQLTNCYHYSLCGYNVFYMY